MSRFGSYSRKVGVALAGVLLCAALPGIARGQDASTTKTTSDNTSFDGVNPCVGEHFAGTGTFTTWEQDSPNKSTFRTQLQGQALNDSRTAKYNVLESSDQEVITTAKTWKTEFEDREHFIREGKTKSAPTKYDDYFQRTRTTTVNGRVTHDEMSAECK